MPIFGLLPIYTRKPFIVKGFTNFQRWGNKTGTGFVQ